MGIIVGSARQDENGKYIGGKAGDQTGKEVSTQAFYIHKLGWDVLRPKETTHAVKIAERMQAACNNNNIGYDQGERLGIIKTGIDTKSKTECDCSSLVRQCVIEATRKDPGNFNTSNEAACLEKTGLFEKRFTYTSKTPIYNGDILVTRSKGHTVVVVSGSVRPGTQSVTDKTNEQIAKEVIAGKWGSGNDRKNRLKEAGYNYSEIQAIVNRLLK